MKTVLFDIDSTLFDTKKFMKSADLAMAEELKQPLEKILEVYKKYRSSITRTAFNPWDYLETLAKEFNVDEKKLEEIFFKRELFEQSLYPDTLATLDAMRGRYQLGTFTEAVILWQEKKLKLSGLINYFDPKITFISSNKISPKLVTKFPASVIIDDKPEYLEKILELRNDIQVIWINRKSDKKHEKFATIHNLGKLEKVIK
ncbi:MAG: HAD family hydrolase [Patescibacteria group bacterium]